MSQNTVLEVNGVRYKVYNSGICSIIIKTQKITYLNADSEITGTMEEVYNDEGRSLKRTAYNGDGSVAWYIESEYDSNGNYIKHINTSQELVRKYILVTNIILVVKK